MYALAIKILQLIIFRIAFVVWYIYILYIVGTIFHKGVVYTMLFERIPIYKITNSRLVGIGCQWLTVVY